MGPPKTTPDPHRHVPSPKTVVSSFLYVPSQESPFSRVTATKTSTLFLFFFNIKPAKSLKIATEPYILNLQFAKEKNQLLTVYVNNIVVDSVAFPHDWLLCICILQLGIWVYFQMPTRPHDCAAKKHEDQECQMHCRKVFHCRPLLHFVRE